jgi:hypothetical protein
MSRPRHSEFGVSATRYGNNDINGALAFPGKAKGEANGGKIGRLRQWAEISLAWRVTSLLLSIASALELNKRVREGL